MNAEQMKKTWCLAVSSIATLLLLTLALYQQTAFYLIGLWNQLDVGEYAHGYLVLAISGYLIFNSRQRLAALVPCIEYRALFGVVTASMLWMVAALVDVQMLQTVGLLLLILALVWTVLGKQVIRVLAFPVLFTAFAIPIWFPLSPVLQNITADAVFGAIRLLSIPALRQDNMIVLPAGTLSIEETCSGLRYLLAALTLGTLYAYMNYSSLRSRLIVVIISAGAAILANMLRVFIVVYLGYATEMQHPLVGDHLSLGWYLFAGLVVILLFFDARFSKGSSMSESIASDAPHETASTTCKNTPVYYFIFVMSVCLLMSAAPMVVYQVKHHSLNGSAKAVPELPHDTEGWLRTDMANDSWMPVYHGAVDQKLLYKKNNGEVIFYVGYYPAQKQGEELINDLNYINNKDIWHTVYPRPRLQSLYDQQVLEQLLANGAGKQRLVWYWYNVAGTVTTNKYEAKVLQVLGLLTGKSWGFVTAAAIETNNDVDFTRQVLKDFILSIEKPMKNEIERISLRH